MNKTEQDIIKVNKKQKELEKELGRKPIPEEIACELGMKLETVEEYLTYRIENIENTDEEFEFKLKMTIKNYTLEKARKKNNLNQTQLAKILDMSTYRYNLIETCRTYPNDWEIKAITKYTKIKESVLFPQWLLDFSTKWGKEKTTRIIPNTQISIASKEILSLPSSSLEEIIKETDNNITKATFQKVFPKILTKKEQEIIEYRYGLKGNVNYTLEETGRMFGITRERVRQIEAKTIEKLRERKEIQGLNPYK